MIDKEKCYGGNDIEQNSSTSLADVPSDSSQQGLDELKALLYSYYSKKMKVSLDELWDAGVLDQQRLDELNNMDLHKL